MHKQMRRGRSIGFVSLEARTDNWDLLIEVVEELALNESRVLIIFIKASAFIVLQWDINHKKSGKLIIR